MEKSIGNWKVVFMGISLNAIDDKGKPNGINIQIKDDMRFRIDKSEIATITDGKAETFKYTVTKDSPETSHFDINDKNGITIYKCLFRHDNDCVRIAIDVLGKDYPKDFILNATTSGIILKLERIKD